MLQLKYYFRKNLIPPRLILNFLCLLVARDKNQPRLYKFNLKNKFDLLHNSDIILEASHSFFEFEFLREISNKKRCAKN